FYNHEILSCSDQIPRYLDLGFYAQSEGIPFTVSSNLMYALSAALKVFDKKKRFLELKELSDWVRAQIQDKGFRVIASDDNASPALITISLPDWLNSSELGQRLQDEGFLLHWRSRYLLDRNWIQIALMGECSQDRIEPLFDLLSSIDNPIRKAL
ncbi:MAG: aminotransferase V, partial [Candidatus Dadabacteria bacterium]|nr:aminotransferase V [Candidatus Dadabacteria bacterium]